MGYQKNKYYSYKFIIQRTDNAPGYLKSEIKKLNPISVNNTMGEKIIGTKISERLYTYLFNNLW